MKFFILFLCLSLHIYSQSDTQIGLLPKLNISYKINPKLKWVNGIEIREKIYDDDFLFEHSLLDLSTSVSYKTNLNQSLTLGYIIRFEEKITHRFLQQYNFIRKFNTLKIGHRLGFEQHLPVSETPFYRFRYRITAQKPLNGEQLNEKEWYLKIGNEYVWNINSKNIEARLSPYLGYKLNTKNKIEIGTEYRVGNILSTLNKHRFWFRTSWYIHL